MGLGLGSGFFGAVRARSTSARPMLVGVRGSHARTSTCIFGVHSAPRLPCQMSRSFHMGKFVSSSFLLRCSLPRTASLTNGLGGAHWAGPIIGPTLGFRRPVASTTSMTTSPTSSAFAAAISAGPGTTVDSFIVRVLLSPGFALAASVPSRPETFMEFLVSFLVSVLLSPPGPGFAKTRGADAPIRPMLVPLP